MVEQNDDDAAPGNGSGGDNNNNNHADAPIQPPPQRSYVERLVQLARDEGLAGLFAGATPRVGKALLSGAIQFATYEETKMEIAKMFQRQEQQQKQ